MTTPKIVTQTTSCGNCPNYRYGSGGSYLCSLVNQRVIEKNEIAPFCPLPDFPSRTIAEMEVTIRQLRAPYQFGFNLAFLSHVATKLKQPLEASCRGVRIPVRGGNSVFLDPDWITQVKISPCEIHFKDGERLYKLFPDAERPYLYQQVQHGEELLWQEMTIG